MSPLSVEYLIQQANNAAKPKFLSKKKRLRLKEQAGVPKQVEAPRKPQIHHEPEEKHDEVKEPASKKKKGHKFEFGWGDAEDTVGDFQPLVSWDVASSDIVTNEKHWSEKPLSNMSSRDWRIFNDDFSIVIKGEQVHHPLRKWSEEEMLPKKLQDIVLDKLRYLEPTPIQRAAVPIALRQKDVVGIAETGSGKTLAYLLPLLAFLSNIDSNYMTFEHQQEGNQNRALALILAPTRELALQIAKEAEKFTAYLGMSVVTIIGGHQYEETVHSLRNGVHIVVATPGRLVDSLERGIISLEKCYHLTLDEADKMIDMGFEKSLQQILSYLPANEQLTSSADGRVFGVQKRSCLMFTATITPAIEKITKNYLQSPSYVFVGGANEAVDNIEQSFEYMGAQSPDKQELALERVSKLVKTLEQHRRNADFSVIIFANYKRVVESLAEELAKRSFGNIAVLHGSKSQDARELAIKTFSERNASILIATDVAARGLDVPHVSLVVNYQMSNKFEEYIHRVGRTGRAGNKGKSHTFIDDGDRDTFAELKKFLRKGGYKIPEWLSKSL